MTDNVEIVRRYVDAVTQFDAEAALPLLHPDMRFHELPNRIRPAGGVDDVSRMMTAPTTAPMKLVPSLGPYQPIAWPIHVASTEPIMPRTVVRMNPAGFLSPGVIHLAISPARNPMMMAQIIPIVTLLVSVSG